MSRRLATVRRIDELRPIEGADMIELAIVDGWQCVVKKKEFTPGSYGVFFEIDSFLDHTKPQFEFLASKAVKWNDNEGVRIRSMKLKGQLSQGLLLPTTVFEGMNQTIADRLGRGMNLEQLNETLNLDESLGVQKWERPIHASLSGIARGNFPSFIPKTDQERVQNLRHIFSTHRDAQFQVTQKLDGSSMTVFLRHGDFGVCSRNLELQEDDRNAFWRTARQLQLEEKLRSIHAAIGYDLAIQGEMIGKSIQGNHEMVETVANEFHVFDIYDITNQEYLNPLETQTLCQDFGLTHVPVIHESIALGEYAKDIPDLLLKAEGPSIRQPIGEGKVFKQVDLIDSSFSFKAISNKFLLKTGN